MGKRTERAERWADRVVRLLPGPIGNVVDRAREDDVFLFSAGLAFYALVSVVPLTIVVLWITSLLLGDVRIHRFAEEVGRLAPKSLGADQAVRRVADLGTSIGFVAVVTGLWPATAYGSGLERAFQRLSPNRKPELEGLKGRGLFFLILLPLFVIGSLIGSYAGATALGSGTVGSVVGAVVALVTGFASAAVAIVLIFKIFPPDALPWRSILRATAVTAGGISILSALFILYLSVGANFAEHYATSGVAGIVLLAVWLFLANVLLLVGYKVALEDAPTVGGKRSGGKRGPPKKR